MGTYGQTYLQLVNKILPRLREATVSTVSENTYSTFIGSLLNQVKAELERSYYWNALRDTYAITTLTDGTSSYVFTGAGPDAVILDGWNTTQKAPLAEGTNAEFDSFFFGSGTPLQSGSVTKYIAAGVSSDFDLKIDVLPTPNTADVLKFNLYVPQADLSNDADVARVPQDVLIEETVARAMVERGDEEAPKPMPGETWILKDMLATAIARESGRDDSEMDWVPE